ncbi:MAG: 50S ribosomal protein L20 [Thermodesulfobacteriota bacterium]
MPRIKRAVHAKKKRRSILKLAKGYRGSRGSLYRSARETVEKGLCYAYRDRKARKREFRRLWIVRINAAARMNGLSYSQLMKGIKAAQVGLDRKALSEIAIADPVGFSKIVAVARENL